MAEAIHTAERLKKLQSLPLDRKIQISQTRIIEWYNHWGGNVVVSFSGGKDSTVLLHLVRSIYPDVKAVFSNTGLEYPEIQKHVKSFDNVDIVVPKMRFDEVISTYGYPLIGKEVAEAIYYARRIRSQSGNVERERERRYSKTENPDEFIEQRKRNELEGQRKRIITDSTSKFSPNSQRHASEKSSHRDISCKEQTNRTPRADEGSRNRAGVASWKLAFSNRGGVRSRPNGRECSSKGKSSQRGTESNSEKPG